VRCRATLIAMTLVLWGAADASADLRIDGHGRGHGIGMSQYGAYGYALKTRHSYRYILGHYYPGTKVQRTRSHNVRVLLKEAPSLLVSEATRLSAPGRKAIALHSDRTYRFEIDGAGLRVLDTKAHRTKARVAAPATVSGGSSVRLRGRAQNGVTSGRYRGSLSIAVNGTNLRAINRVGLETYLYGVVPSEMPASWPLTALEVQAVAARSYAIRSLTPSLPFDVFADTRSQVYKGMTGESSHSTLAVRKTRRQVVTYKGGVAFTFFSSSSGGRTAAIDEEFGSPPVPYLVPVDDPFDTLSPDHNWTVTLSTAEAQKRLHDLLLGTLQDVVVTARNSSARAATVEIRGSAGTVTASGSQVQSALGLKSTLFTTTFSAP
jgi:stage II sporulation protein D